MPQLGSDASQWTDGAPGRDGSFEEVHEWHLRGIHDIRNLTPRESVEYRSAVDWPPSDGAERPNDEADGRTGAATNERPEQRDITDVHRTSTLDVSGSGVQDVDPSESSSHFAL